MFVLALWLIRCSECVYAGPGGVGSVNIGAPLGLEKELDFSASSACFMASGISSAMFESLEAAPLARFPIVLTLTCGMLMPPVIWSSSSGLSADILDLSIRFWFMVCPFFRLFMVV